jgi:hypothetical protein
MAESAIQLDNQPEAFVDAIAPLSSVGGHPMLPPSPRKSVSSLDPAQILDFEKGQRTRGHVSDDRCQHTMPWQVRHLLQRSLQPNRRRQSVLTDIGDDRDGTRNPSGGCCVLKHCLLDAYDERASRRMRNGVEMATATDDDAVEPTKASLMINRQDDPIIGGHRREAVQTERR